MFFKSSIRKYYLLGLLENKSFEKKHKLAVSYHRRKLTGHLFKQWLEWLRYRKDRQASNIMNKLIKWRFDFIFKLLMPKYREF